MIESLSLGVQVVGALVLYFIAWYLFVYVEKDHPDDL